MKTPILHGSFVTLRPLSLKDAPRLCKWLNDPEVTVTLAHHGSAVLTLAAEREWIKNARCDAHGIHFAIATREGQHIGVAGLRQISGNNNADFGLMIGDKSQWGRGFGTETTSMILSYGFEALNLHRIFLRCFSFNRRGLNIYKRVGFKREGRLREHILRDGKYYDEIIMGMLKSDWRPRPLK